MRTVPALSAGEDGPSCLQAGSGEDVESGGDVVVGVVAVVAVDVVE
jgi:hypothetical protein